VDFEPQVTDGTFQEPLTSLTDPLDPVTAKPLQLVLQTVPEGQLKALRGGLARVGVCTLAKDTLGKKVRMARMARMGKMSVLEEFLTKPVLCT